MITERYRKAFSSITHPLLALLFTVLAFFKIRQAFMPFDKCQEVSEGFFHRGGNVPTKICPASLGLFDADGFFSFLRAIPIVIIIFTVYLLFIRRLNRERFFPALFVVTGTLLLMKLIDLSNLDTLSLWLIGLFIADMIILVFLHKMPATFVLECLAIGVLGAWIFTRTGLMAER
jgi:hypothetical protein